jgi:hypothetical protein
MCDRKMGQIGMRLIDFDLLPILLSFIFLSATGRLLDSHRVESLPGLV